jgi:hypothetical protein
MSQCTLDQNLTHELLVNAKAKISKIENWTQGHLARNESMVSVRPGDPSATCWCAVGAVESLRTHPGVYYRDYSERKALRLLNIAASPLFGSIPELNDHNESLIRSCEPLVPVLPASTHALVLEMFDKAIELSLDPAQH